MIEIKIPNWHPAPLNQLIGGHWSKGAKRKKGDKNIVSCYALHLPKAETKKRVHLAIILGKGQRACDPDAYWKSLCDALVHCGMLVNDSHKWVELAPVKFVRGEMATIIQLEDLGGN